MLACKSDLSHRIPPQDAVQVVYKYDGGIVEISHNDVGKEKARRCVGVLLRGVQRRRCMFSFLFIYVMHDEVVEC